jgi:hypothetical protein
VKTQSPVLGFNTNVRHKGKVFHIQTEDSGVKHPHIITHVFADGGRILKSTKTSYADHVSEPNLTETVGTMMKDQHKAMFMALRDGAYDDLIDGPAAPEAARAAAAAAPKAPRIEPVSPGPSNVRADPVAADAWTGIPVDMDVLERAASEGVSQSKLVQPQSDMPPPTAATLSHKRPAGSYRGVPAAEQPQDARYVASRPAAIFAAARPAEGGNVFGDDMISDKSLDEVILSFLSEEFGTDPDDDSGSNKR